MRKSSLLFVCAVLVSLAIPVQSNAESDMDIWNKAVKKIMAVKDYQCQLHVFIWNTPEAIKHKPMNSEGKENKEYWYIYDLDMKWKEPGYVHVRVVRADNPGTDLATKQIKKKPGTQIVFGYKDDTDIYGKFPKTGDPVIDKQVEKHIFHMPASAFEGTRPELGFNSNIKSITNYLCHYNKDGKISMEVTAMPEKLNLNFDPDEGSVKYDLKQTSRKYYKFTMIPDDPKKHVGTTREFVYIDMDTLMPMQFEVYENDRLVVVFNIEGLETDIGLSDSLWENYFKGAAVFSPTGG